MPSRLKLFVFSCNNGEDTLGALILKEVFVLMQAHSNKRAIVRICIRNVMYTGLSTLVLLVIFHPIKPTSSILGILSYLVFFKWHSLLQCINCTVVAMDFD